MRPSDQFDQEPVRGMCRRKPRAGDVDAPASKVSLLEVPAMAISSTTPGNGCGRTCQRLCWTLTRTPKESIEVS